MNNSEKQPEPRILPGKQFLSELKARGCFAGDEYLNSVELQAASRIANVFNSSLVLPESANEYYDHGYRSGELHESNLWQIASGIDNARPFSVKESVTIPDIHIGLLIDCSGSMASYSEAFGNTRTSGPDQSAWGRMSCACVINAARTLALGMAKSLDSQKTVHLSIAGHTELNGEVTMIMVKRPKSCLNVDAFGKLVALSGNLDGLAIMAMAREMAKEMKDGEPGVLFLISDGAPCHSPLIMETAFKRSKTLHNITVFPIGVGRDMDDELCQEIYNGEPYVVAPDVLSSAPAIVAKVNNIVSRLKPM